MRAGLLLAPPPEYSEEGARGGCCLQPICAACLRTRLVSQAPTSLSEDAGEPFSQEVEVPYGWSWSYVGADPRWSPGTNGPLSAPGAHMSPGPGCDFSRVVSAEPTRHRP